MYALKNRVVALVLLIALAIGMILPFFAVYNPHPSSVGDNISPFFGEKILICTGEGFKWLRFADIQSGKERLPPHSSYKCPLCYIHAHGLNAVMAGAALSALLAYVLLTYSRFGFMPIPFSIASHIKSRAPPYSFID